MVIHRIGIQSGQGCIMVRIMLLALLLLTSSGAISVPLFRLGAVTSVVFPSVDPPGPVGSMNDLERIFFPDDPIVTVGGRVEVNAIAGFPFELSGTYGSYDPWLEFSASFPDSVDVVFRKGDLVTVEAGFSHELGDISLLAGADFYFYHESWMDKDTLIYDGGCHREYSETLAGAYLGAGKFFDLLPVASFIIDLRLHFPDFSERWFSAGLSLMFH